MGEVLKGAAKNWGKWGEEDGVGALNYLTTEEVFRYTAAPLKVNEASGSPVSPLVIK